MEWRREESVEGRESRGVWRRWKEMKVLKRGWRREGGGERGGGERGGGERVEERG